MGITHPPRASFSPFRLPSRVPRLFRIINVSASRPDDVFYSKCPVSSRSISLLKRTRPSNGASRDLRHAQPFCLLIPTVIFIYSTVPVILPTSKACLASRIVLPSMQSLVLSLTVPNFREIDEPAANVNSTCRSFSTFARS